MTDLQTEAVAEMLRDEHLRDALCEVIYVCYRDTRDTTDGQIADAILTCPALSAAILRLLAAQMREGEQRIPESDLVRLARPPAADCDMERAKQYATLDCLKFPSAQYSPDMCNLARCVQAQAEAHRADLVKYGDHIDDCEVYDKQSRTCTCGLETAIAALTGRK